MLGKKILTIPNTPETPQNKKTTFCGFHPLSTNKKCKCILSPLKIDLFFKKNLFKITDKKSINGKANTIKVIAILAPVKIAKEPKIKPENKLPLSPKKNFAGYLFKNKKPIKTPAKTKERKDSPCSLKFVIVVNKKIDPAPNITIPETKPSKPSRIFVV